MGLRDFPEFKNGAFTLVSLPSPGDCPQNSVALFWKAKIENEEKGKRKTATENYDKFSPLSLHLGHESMN